jgi:lactobin A/cerein 7B family class IIb bacteriocin
MEKSKFQGFNVIELESNKLEEIEGGIIELIAISFGMAYCTYEFGYAVGKTIKNLGY